MSSVSPENGEMMDVFPYPPDICRWFLRPSVRRNKLLQLDIKSNAQSIFLKYPAIKAIHFSFH